MNLRMEMEKKNMIYSFSQEHFQYRPLQLSKTNDVRL